MAVTCLVLPLELLCVLDLVEPKILKVHLLFDRVGSVFFSRYLW